MSKSKKLDLTDTVAIDAALANITPGQSPLAGDNPHKKGTPEAAGFVKSKRSVISPQPTAADVRARGVAAAEVLRDTSEIESAARDVLSAVAQLEASVALYKEIAADRRVLAVSVARAAYPNHSSTAATVAEQLGELAGLTSVMRIHVRNAALAAVPDMFSAQPAIQERDAFSEIERNRDHLLRRLDALITAGALV
jgi:hypothetical protein